jgi:hypothetical protein
MGINPYSGGWEMLYRKLSRYTHGFALDEKAWDASLSRPLLEGVRDLRWRFISGSYSDDDASDMAKRRLHRLYEDIIESVVTTGIGEYFQKVKGNPSGSGNTGPDNTFIMYALLAASYHKTTGRNYNQFNRDVSLAIYGDDNTFTVNPDVIDRFNGASIKEVLARYGVEVKGENLEPRPLDELDFLKKRFVKEGNTVVFRPIDPDKHVASLALRMVDPSPAGRLGRACAVRQLLVFAPVEYHLVDTWCRKLLDTYKHLAGDEDWDGAVSQYLPLDTLIAHYLRPQEGASRRHADLAAALRRKHTSFGGETKPSVSLEETQCLGQGEECGRVEPKSRQADKDVRSLVDLGGAGLPPTISTQWVRPVER